MSNPSLNNFSAKQLHPEDLQVFANHIYDLIDTRKKDCIALIENNFSSLKISIQQMVLIKLDSLKQKDPYPEESKVPNGSLAPKIENVALNELLDMLTSKLSIHTPNFRVSILTKRYLTKEIDEVFMKNLENISIEYANNFLNKVCQCYDIRWLLNHILSYEYLLKNTFVFNHSHVRLYKSIDGSRDTTSLLNNIVNKTYSCITYFDGIFHDFLENPSQVLYNTLEELINTKLVLLNEDHGKKLVNKIVQDGYTKQNSFVKWLLEIVRKKLFQIETNMDIDELFKTIIYKENAKYLIMFCELYQHELNSFTLSRLIKVVIEREEQVGYDLGFFKTIFYQFICPLFIGMCEVYNEHHLSFNNSLLLQDKRLVTIPESIVTTLKKPSHVLPPRYKDMCKVLSLCPEAKIAFNDFIIFLHSSERDEDDTSLFKVYKNRLSDEEMELVKTSLKTNSPSLP